MIDDFEPVNTNEKEIGVKLIHDNKDTHKRCGGRRVQGGYN
jgi:hypothetical protein